MDKDYSSTPGEQGGIPEDDSRGEREKGHLVRLLKPVAVTPATGKAIDGAVVSPRFYNRFNFSLLAKDGPGLSIAIGVTSANAGEGKTLVASNLAVSLASANQRDTVLVDLNIALPRLHSIFGARLTPGLVEALAGSVIQVSETKVNHLYILSSGNVGSNPVIAERMVAAGRREPGHHFNPSLGLEQVAAFRDIMYSLKQEFDFVVVDMPSIREPSVPALLSHQMDGLIVVVDTNRTKQEDIRKMFTRVRENQILGFVFNRVTGELGS